MYNISRDELLRLIYGTQGKFFSVRFIKKDGTDREMTCRLGVKRGVKGIGLKYEPLEKGLICVFDMNKKGGDERGAFRMLNLNTIYWIKVNGIEYNVKEEL